MGGERKKFLSYNKNNNIFLISPSSSTAAVVATIVLHTGNALKLLLPIPFFPACCASDQIAKYFHSNVNQLS